MRNLNKLLALVVTLSMIMSFVVSVSAAGDQLGTKTSRDTGLFLGSGNGVTSAPITVPLSAPVLDMIFSIDTLSVTGSSKIVGNTGTNSVAADSVNFAGPTGIEGDLFIGPEADWTEVVKSARPDAQSNVTGEISNLPLVREYPLPEFPMFPDLEDKGDLVAGWGTADQHIINESGFYNSMSVTNLLTINVGDEDIQIVIGRLAVTDGGSIVVNRTGAGRLILYVADQIEITGNGKINNSGSCDDVIMYYSGSGSLNFGGATKFVGSIFAEDSNFSIGGSGGITGNIVTGGSAVNVTGNAEAYVRVIYAPNATLTITGNGRIKGIAVALGMELSGSARIIYDGSINLDFFEQLDWGEQILEPTPYDTSTYGGRTDYTPVGTPAPLERPSAAGRYVEDPSFNNTKIYRMTDESNFPISGVIPYGCIPVMNCNSTRVYFLNMGVGHTLFMFDFNPVTMKLTNGKNMFQNTADLITTSSVWSFDDPDVIYGLSTSGSKIIGFNVATQEVVYKRDLSAELPIGLHTSQMSKAHTNDRFFSFSANAGNDNEDENKRYACVYDRQLDQLYKIDITASNPDLPAG